MFQDTDAATAEDSSTASETVKKRHAALGPTVARLCKALANRDVLFVAADEARGEAVAKAMMVASGARVLWCPPLDVLPGDTSPASCAVLGRRVAALSALHRRDDRPLLFVTDASAAAHKTALPEAFGAADRVVTIGDTIDSEALTAELEAIGYFQDDRIDEPGEMAVRGATIDVFPADSDMPARIRIEDACVSAIEGYDPVSQLGTGESFQHLTLVSSVEPDPGPVSATIFDHLPDALIALDPEAASRRDRFIELAAGSGNAVRYAGRLADAKDWDAALTGRDLLSIEERGETSGERFVEGKRPAQAVAAAVRQAREAADRIVITGSARDIRFISRRFKQTLGQAPSPVTAWHEIATAEPGSILAIELDLDRGWREPGLTVIAAADILGARALETATASTAPNPLMREHAEFHTGDAVIHEEHGLGVLGGLETVTTGDQTSTAIRLEYAGGAQRLVPVEDADRLWRYGAEAEAVTLDKLDGTSWAKRRGDIEAAIAETARQLVTLSAERATRTAPVLDPPVADYERFASGFAFNETADQTRAIQAVRADLASGKPMDRLVVGDVGYGKTEVALRAAAFTALAGKQVAIVAPTTVLVRQHIETFRRRFATSGIAVAGLSRLSTPAEIRETKKGLADGSIRIVIGTSAVAGKGVAFHGLGLVVIDEEQRFGTADKAKLRAIAANAHVLTLTATPIPRTLQTALVGLQDLSLITTPPARRQPTRTSVATFAPDIVRSALLREKRRSGQSFAVVPRIDDMAVIADRLRELVPGLIVRQAHGKMQPAQIDEDMVAFAGGNGDILLATNIIEAGLDIPRANTMILFRADRFGLSQLHQLRGRVGRGRVRGQLVLLTEEDAKVAPSTLKRLRTLEALDQLGAGFAISARDLDMRGAGDLLGDEQAGHMKLIGTELYQHLLEAALRTARCEEVDDWTPELNLGVGGCLPEDWIPEVEVRVTLYVRIARLKSAGEVDALIDELEDRFGALPPEAARLIEAARIRQLARSAQVVRIDAGPAAIALTPRGKDKLADPALVSKGGRFMLATRSEADEHRLDLIRTTLERLGDG